MTPSSRPLSPHLQVYRLPLLAVLSVVHRATGVALAAGMVLLAWWLGAAAAGPDFFATVQAVLGSWLGRLVLLGFTVSLFYHLANGIRHLLWDVGWGFDLPHAYASGRIVVAATAALTALAWIAALV